MRFSFLFLVVLGLILPRLSWAQAMSTSSGSGTSVMGTGFDSSATSEYSSPFSTGASGSSSSGSSATTAPNALPWPPSSTYFGAAYPVTGGVNVTPGSSTNGAAVSGSTSSAGASSGTGTGAAPVISEYFFSGSGSSVGSASNASATAGKSAGGESGAGAGGGASAGGGSSSGGAAGPITGESSSQFPGL